MDWKNQLEIHDTVLLVAISTLAVSHILSQWIHDHYYLLEYVFLILLFGLFHEAWSSMQTDEAMQDLLKIFGANSKTAQQIILLWFIGSAVFISIQLRNIVESVIGPLSVVQMLGLIVVLSRAFVNVYTTKNLFAILDGEPDTYAAYTAGITAFIISWQIQNHYAAHTWMHNIISIWPSILVPWFVLYYSRFGDDLPDFTRTSFG